MSTRDELADAIEQAYRLNEGMVSFELLASAILAAGYRKAEPVWEPSLLNDGVYEYTQTSTCDGSKVYNYRRLPRLQHDGEFPSWESYEPEAAK